MKFREITKNIYSNYSLNDIRNRMKLLGCDDDKEVLKFLNIRLLTSIIIFFMILYLVKWGYIFAPIIVVLYYIFLPNLTIDQKIKKRKAKLESEAMYFFEILSLSLESGNNLYNAINVTSENIDSELSNEFKKMMIDINYSKSFNEAINDMKDRIPSDTINNNKSGIKNTTDITLILRGILEIYAFVSNILVSLK